MVRKMKDSGVEWIGRIPKEWDLKRVKYCCQYIVDKVSVLDENLEYLLYIGLEHVEQQTGNLECGYKPIYDFTGETIRFNKGDVVFGKLRPYLAKCFVAESEGKCSSEFFVLRSKDSISARYIKWAMLSKGFIDYVDSSTFGVKMPRVDWSFMGNIFLPVPSHAIQENIADYLDQKCADIDKVISAKQTQNQLLKEQRRSLIYEAVTKGHDKNVNYRNSNMGWVDKLPEEWEERKLKYIAYLQSGDMITTQHIEEEGQYPVYGGNGLRGYTNDFTHDGKYILIGRQGALCGNVHLVEGKFWASEHAIVVTLFDDYNPDWLRFVLEAMKLNQYSESAAQPGISVNRIQNLLLPLPPTNIEQQQIAESLSQKCSEIDRIINSNDVLIEKLREYRQSLIYEAVTGKIEV